MATSYQSLAELSRQLHLVLIFKPDMKSTQHLILLSVLLILNSCIIQFIPETNEDKELLVVEGLITDQPGVNTVKLSKSLPLGRKNVAKPLKGCIVKIIDDLGQIYILKETVAGTYVTDPAIFRGVTGRQYSLHINTNTSYNNLNFESFPVEMKPAPPIDSLYYEKKTIKEKDDISQAEEGCQVYLNTHDPANNCNFYRWEYSETWEFRLPYDVPNKVCWISNNSDKINVKNTSVLEQARISRYPLNFISNVTDRLKVKYSILVNQYSLNEDEYFYWEKLQNISEQVGGLYDITPAAIPSNVYCLEDPNEKVLGYFSVSAVTSERLFIKDRFSGLINLYTNCASDTIFGRGPIPGLNVSVWVIYDGLDEDPPNRIITYSKECADCTVRGTKIEPLFWKDGK
jgi:hypothetical protein